MNARLTPDEIAAHYNRTVLPIIVDIEAKRIAACNRFALFAGIAIVLDCAVIAFTYYGGYYNGAHMSNALQLTLLMIVGSVYAALWPLRTFQKTTKSQLLQRILPLFPGFALDEKRTLDRITMQRAGIFPSFDRDAGGNHITGRYRDTDITSVDVELQEERRSKNSKRMVTVFKGTVYIFQFPKSFTHHIRITSDKGWLGNKLYGVIRGERVALEDPVFEDLFEVYAEDQVEARYILTTGFMNRLIALAGRNNKGIEAAFFDNKLLLKTKKDDLRFTVTNPLKRIDWQEEAFRFVDEFQDALTVVDELKLNQKIGL